MKKRIGQWVLAALLAWPAVVAWGAPDGFERYRVILERKPFGEPPPEPPEPPPPPAEDPPWAKTYRLCSVYQEEGEPVEVALLDLKTNKPVMLTLGGGPNEGIELVSADVETEEATLVREGLQVTMNLEASKTPAPKPKPPQANKKPPNPRRPAGKPGAAVPPANQPAKPAAPPTPRSRGVIRATRR